MKVRLPAIMSILAVLLGCMASAPTEEAPRFSKPLDTIGVASAEDAPFFATPVAAVYHSGSPDADPLSIQFLIENRSDTALSGVGLEVQVFTPEGRYRGMHGFFTHLSLAPGESEAFNHAIPFAVDLLDRVVVLPISAHLEENAWTVDASRLNEVAREFIDVELAPREEPLARFGRKATVYEHQSLSGVVTPLRDCSFEFCINAESRCESLCSCGVQEFSCDETNCTYTCKCFQCPT